VSATVGEHELPTEEITVGDRRQLAWMVANVLDHTRVWFTNTNRHYVSDDEQPGRANATDVLLGRSVEDNSSTTD
jgi:hypothetical protein